MGEVTVHYFATVMTVTKCSYEKFTLPDEWLKISDLTRLIVARYPDTEIDRVLESSRWIVGGAMVSPSEPFDFKDGDNVHIVPRLVGG